MDGDMAPRQASEQVSGPALLPDRREKTNLVLLIQLAASSRKSTPSCASTEDYAMLQEAAAVYVVWCVVVVAVLVLVVVLVLLALILVLVRVLILVPVLVSVLVVVVGASARL